MKLRDFLAFMGVLENVIPAKAGIQKLLKLLDPRLRGDDKVPFPTALFMMSLVLSYPGFVFAETLVEIDKITVIAPVEDSVLLSGQSTLKIQDSGVSENPAELVSRVAGVHVLQFGGLEQNTGLSLRGSSHNQVSLFLDGVPLDTASNMGVGIQNLSTQSLAKISIYKSFSPAELGSTAVGGAIHLTTKPVQKGWHSRFSFGAGSFESVQGFGEIERGGDDHDFLLQVNARRTQGNFKFLDDNGTPVNTADDQVVTRQNNEFQVIHPFLKWIYRFDDKTSLELTQHFFQIDSGVPGIGSFQSLNADKTLTEWLGHLALTREGAFFKNTTLKNAVFWRVIRSQFSDPNGEIGLGAGQDTDNRTLIFGDRVQFVVPIAQHKLKLGSEFLAESFTPRDDLAATHFGSTSKRQQLNFSFEPQLNFFQDRLQIDTVFWLGNVFYNINNNDPSLTNAGTFFSNKTEHPFTGALAVRYPVFSFLTAKGSVGRAVRLPQFAELFGDQGFVLGNPQLLSETSLKFDLGFSVNKNFSGKVQKFFGEVLYFENHVDDLIQFEIINGVARASNIGEALVRGVEISTHLKFLKNFELSQNYTWQRALDQALNAGLFLVGRPEHEANSTILFRHKNLMTSSSLNFIHRQYLNSLNTQVVQNRFRFDVEVEYKFLEKLILSLEAKNIFGTQIVDAVGFPLPGRSFMARAEISF